MLFAAHDLHPLKQGTQDPLLINENPAKQRVQTEVLVLVAQFGGFPALQVPLVVLRKYPWEHALQVVLEVQVTQLGVQIVQAEDVPVM